MTQTTTFISHFRTLPGHIYTPEGAGRETESLLIPYTPQQLTFTIAGENPITAGDYEFRFVSPVGAFTVTVALGAVTPTVAAAAVAVALNANPQSGQYFVWTSNAGVVIGVAKSANTSFPVPTTTTNGATTNVAAISVAAAANSMRMGLWYVYGAPTSIGAITGTPRGARLAALPTVATTVAQLRGVLARPVNQTQLSPTFNDANSFDAYRAGQIGFGALRAEVCVVVSPESGTVDPDDAIYVVIAAGTNSLVGSITTLSDGGNTLRVDNTTPVRARVTAVEETLAIGGSSQRVCVLEVNQTA